MKKLKHEAELVKLAISVGMKYGENRKAVQFEETDSQSERYCTCTGYWCMTNSSNPFPKTRYRNKPCDINSPCGFPNSYRKGMSC